MKSEGFLISLRAEAAKHYESNISPNQRKENAFFTGWSSRLKSLVTCFQKFSLSSSGNIRKCDGDFDD